jgi:hypothetical protein
MVYTAACGATGANNAKPNKATSMASIRSHIPTDTPQPPTPTIPPEDIVKDISMVMLQTADFPEGYKRLSKADMEDMDMSPEGLTKSITNDLSKATVQSPSGFMRVDGQSVEIAISMVIYPLTMVEASGFDVDIAEPEAFMNDFIAPGGSEGRLLEGMEGIGEKGVGFDYKIAQENADDPPGRGQFIIARRGNAALMVFVMYFNSETASANAVELARTLDGRLAEALAK